jgi:hypothetical protein
MNAEQGRKSHRTTTVCIALITSPYGWCQPTSTRQLRVPRCGGGRRCQRRRCQRHRLAWSSWWSSFPSSYWLRGPRHRSECAVPAAMGSPEVGVGRRVFVQLLEGAPRRRACPRPAASP